MLNTVTIRSTLMALACAFSLSAYAMADTARKVDVPAGELTDALRALAEQSGVEFVYSAEQLKGIRTRGVRGELTAEKAILKLLEGTELKVKVHPSGALLISDVRPPNAPMSDLRQTVPPVSASASNVDAASTPTDSSPPVSGSDSRDNSDRVQERIELAEIIVTGSRLRVPVTQSAQPITVVSREYIQNSGATSINQLLSRIPQASTNQLASTMLIEGGASTVNLRGLPNGSTLVLINGRRMGTSGHISFLDSFDLNAIPPAAIERIEILSSGASAIYGADALAGVMNVILRKDVDGVILDLNYGGATDGAYDEGGASGIVGFDSGKFRGTLILNAYKRDPLSANDRPRTILGDYTALGGSDTRFDLTNPGNVFSLTGDNLPGLSSDFAAVPRGSTGIGLTPASFASTAGTENLDSPFRDAWLLHESRRNSVIGTFEADLGSVATGFVELMATDSDEIGNTRVATAFVVPASNAFNPFGEDVLVFYAYPGEASFNHEVFENEVSRAVAGFKGAIGRWEWEASWLGTREKSHRTLTNDLDVTALLESSDPAVAFNPFRDGLGAASSVLAPLVLQQLQHSQSDGRQWDAFVRGPLFSLPAGSVDVVLGGLHRTDRIIFDGRFGQVGEFDFDRSISSVFGELRLPITSAENSRIGGLTATLASRRDSFSDFGDHTSSQLGVSWSVLERLTLRSSFAQSFKAPSLYRLYQPLRTFNGVITDPLRGNERYSVSSGQVGNVNLAPEEGESTSAGLVLALGPDRNGQLSVDWWKLDLSERILGLSFQAAVDNETAFPDLVTRGPQTPADIAANRPGRITRAIASTANGGEGDLEGIDLNFEYRHAAWGGALSTTAAATYVMTYRGATAIGTPVLDRAGAAFTDGFSPEWKAIAGAQWSRQGFELGAYLRYTSSYRDYATAPEERRVADSHDIDLNFAYTLQPSLGSFLGGLSFRLTVRNLLDSDPPFADTFVGYDTLQGDVVGRVASFAIHKEF